MDRAFGGDLDTREPTDQALSDLTGDPAGMLALHVPDTRSSKGRGLQFRVASEIGTQFVAASPREKSSQGGVPFDSNARERI
jgi:hypothetical protein